MAGWFLARCQRKLYDSMITFANFIVSVVMVWCVRLLKR
jgi:hypothetical protein